MNPKRFEGPSKALDDLKSGASHVSYEISMLIHSGESLGGRCASPISGSEDDDENMTMECFLLHFRNLRAFVCPTLQNEKKDDILAVHFLGVGHEKDVGDKIRLGRDKHRLDKMLAHLSYTRARFIEAKNYHWLIAEMMYQVLGELEKFFATLNADRRSWFTPAEQIAKTMARAEQIADAECYLLKEYGEVSYRDLLKKSAADSDAQ